jgi:CHAT domain-containing protein/tetratricopeptide (TPR) repeat protein
MSVQPRIIVRRAAIRSKRPWRTVSSPKPASTPACGSTSGGRLRLDWQRVWQRVWQRDNLLQAEFLVAYLEAAVNLPRRGQWALARSYRLIHRWRAYEEAGRYAEARRAARLRLTIRRRWLGDALSEIFYDVKILAESTQHAGDLAAAEVLHREAIVLSRRFFGRHNNTATALMNLGTLLRARQELEEAERLYREAMEIRSERYGPGHPLTADCRNNLGNLYLDRGDTAAAERTHREVLAHRQAALGAGDPQVATSLNNLAMTLQEHGDLVQAESLLEEAIAIRRRCFGEGHPLVARSLSNLGVIKHLQGDLAGAEPLLRDAVKLHRQVLGLAHRDSAESIANLAYHLLVRGDSRAAEAELTDWATVYETARESAGPGLAPAKALVSHYPALAVARLRLGALRGAWDAAERHLGRLVVDWVAAAARRETDMPRNRQERTVAALKAKVATLESAAVQGGGEGGNAEQITLAVQSARDLLLLAEARAARAQFAKAQLDTPGAHPGPMPLARVQGALEERTAIVGWLDVESRLGVSESWGYAVRHRGETAWVKLSPDGAARTAHPGRLRSILAAPRELWGDQVLPPAHTLWRERIQPLAAVLDDVEELIVVPSGTMLGIPIEALVDDEGRYLGDRHIVSYAPSATVHAWLVEHPRTPGSSAGRSALFIGDPPFSVAHATAMQAEEAVHSALAGPESEWEVPRDHRRERKAPRRDQAAIAKLPRLAGSRQEITSLAPHFVRSTILVGEAASERRLLALAAAGELRAYDVLHIATHALVDDVTPERSSLIFSQVGLPDPLAAALADERIETGLITAADIARDLQFEAELVTLSACETALGRPIGGEGYVGFMHAFFAAGARSQLVSLWKVDDQATCLLMGRFYENWLGDYSEPRAEYGAGEAMGKATALREAKQWLRGYTDRWGGHPYEHPYFWAAFILFGAR